MDPLMGTIITWGPNFPPLNWAFCDGQLMSIGSNPALYSLIGTIYGGDARTTYSLPDSRGRSFIGTGYAPGMLPYNQGVRGGLEFVTLSHSEMPVHTHTATSSGGSGSSVVPAINTPATTDTPAPGHYLAKGNTTIDFVNHTVEMYAAGTPDTYIEGSSSGAGSITISNAGSSSSHENRSPYIVTRYIISLSGVYPSRN